MFIEYKIKVNDIVLAYSQLGKQLDCKTCLYNDGYKIKECNTCKDRIAKAKNPIITCKMITL